MNKTFTDLHAQALTMGEHIEQMREAHEAVVRERDALAARVKRLEFHTRNLRVTCSRYEEPCNRTAKGFTTEVCSDYSKIEAIQSINHVKAQVEEETIERCVSLIQDDPNTYRDDSDIALENMPRKYAKQAGPTVEEGE